ncbi:protein shisa-5-like isoform X1 [Narcine bancroftii]|uniref:protein shisa-5-like isoform X1 n=1 Tax=Narcine bancroftii TaxID=1343680 RepID=UPI003831F81B
MNCLLLVCMAISSCDAISSVECSFSFSGVNCRENNTTKNILIGVAVVGSIIVIGGILSCCCCGCCACCRSEPRHSTVVTTAATTVMPLNCSQPMQTYPQCHGYQPLPVQPFPAQKAMTAAPSPYVIADQNQGLPPSYQEAVPGYPSYIPTKNLNDRSAFIDVPEPGM